MAYIDTYTHTTNAATAVLAAYLHGDLTAVTEGLTHMDRHALNELAEACQDIADRAGQHLDAKESA